MTSGGKTTGKQGKAAGRRAKALPLVLVALFVPLLACTSNAHAEFSSGQLSAIAEHVFRGTSKIRSCETTCSSLWSAEQEGGSKELNLELLELRQEIGLLPRISAKYSVVPLTGSPRSVYWGVPGERPMIITIKVPAESEASYWCKEGCNQRLQGYAMGESPGYFKGALPEDALVWTWEAPPGVVAGRLVPPKEGYCEGHPAIPSGMTIISGPQESWCYPGAIEEVGYLPEPAFVTSTPIRDEGKELPYTFQTTGATNVPSLEVLKEELASDLTPGKYPYLVQWYHFQFGEGCNPETCKVPDCKALSLEACEALLGEAGFANLENSTEAEGNADFYVPPEDVTRTSPAAGSEVAVNSPVHVYINPVEEAWKAILLNRFDPVMDIPPTEVFEPESPALMSDWPLDQLHREFGPAVEGPGITFLGSPYSDQEPAVGGDYIDSITGLEGTEVELSAKEAGEFIVGELVGAYPGKYDHRVYADVASDPYLEQTYLQYWFFYYENLPIFENFDSHEGDWEMAQFEIDGLPSTGLLGGESGLGPGPTPRYATAAEHSYGARCGWEELNKEHGVPVLYPAQYSHATYFGPGEFETEGPGVSDVVTGEGEHLRAQVVPISEADGWVQWPGRWGGTSPELPWPLSEGEGISPPGPIGHGQWSEPTAWDSEWEFGEGGCP
jgi:hypothetical protein